MHYVKNEESKLLICLLSYKISNFEINHFVFLKDKPKYPLDYL